MSGASVLARRAFGDRVIRRAKAHRLRLAEMAGSHRFSRTALFGLDALLVSLLVAEPAGTFLEFGANDGLQQSNTYALERELGWRGVLVEPVPQLAAECLLNRPLANVVVGAVGGALKSELVRIIDLDLLSGSSQDSRLAAASIPIDDLIDQMFSEVPTLISIDVEGAEVPLIEALVRGGRMPPILLVETDSPRTALSCLQSSTAVFAVTHHDYLCVTEQLLSVEKVQAIERHQRCLGLSVGRLDRGGLP